MEGTVFSLIPPLIMLILVLVTRKVLLSLGAGIIAGSLLIEQFDPVGALQTTWSAFAEIFVVEGEIQQGSLFLLLFLLFLGMMGSFLAASGGTKAFGRWAAKKVKTRKGAQFVPAVLGIIIFIDDYFNSLAVGQVARPLSDRYNVSRAKLAYIIDSTSAPVTVISPVSSWGAYIIGLLGSIIAASQITGLSGLEAFIQMIPMNLYAIAAILLVFLSIQFRVNLGMMSAHENRAISTGELLDPERERAPGDVNRDFVEHDHGKLYHLFLPIIVLLAGTVIAMIWTGIQHSSESVTILSIFSNTDVNFSLFAGGLASVVTAMTLYMMISQPKSSVFQVLSAGIRSMLPAIYILIFAWMIGTIIDQMQTGVFLAGLVEQSSLNPSFLPLIMFMVAGIMAFATGTSWGTFGMMLPIAGEIAANTDVSVFLPSLAAVLAGSVFGDHCSPISDTTILSSTGAGANHIDHVLTQLPYALTAAISALAGYIVIGFFGSWILGLFVTLLVLSGLTWLISSRFMNKKSYENQMNI